MFFSDEGVTKTFTCARPLIGQHVFLQLVGVEGSLSLCEVEVFTTEGTSLQPYCILLFTVLVHESFDLRKMPFDLELEEVIYTFCGKALTFYSLLTFSSVFQGKESPSPMLM